MTHRKAPVSFISFPIIFRVYLGFENFAPRARTCPSSFMKEPYSSISKRPRGASTATPSKATTASPTATPASVCAISASYSACAHTPPLDQTSWVSHGVRVRHQRVVQRLRAHTFSFACCHVERRYPRDCQTRGSRPRALRRPRPCAPSVRRTAPARMGPLTRCVTLTLQVEITSLSP